MRIFHMHIREGAGGPNFGDELSMWLWPKLLNPGMSHILPDGLFYGIGTHLGRTLPTSGSTNVIFGSGAGYRGDPAPDETWRTYFVRGPHTARKMPKGTKYITDPAVLIRKFAKKQDPVYPVAFMPRYDTEFDRAALIDAGIHLIPPNASVDHVIQAIAHTDMLLTETLHGAITADTMRVPWICVYGSHGHHFKWHDWCGSLNMVWTPVSMSQYTLDWARKFAVPQLSAESEVRRAVDRMMEEVDVFNENVERETV